MSFKDNLISDGDRDKGTVIINEIYRGTGLLERAEMAVDSMIDKVEGAREVREEIESEMEGVENSMGIARIY